MNDHFPYRLPDPWSRLLMAAKFHELVDEPPRSPVNPQSNNVSGGAGHRLITPSSKQRNLVNDNVLT